MVLKKYVHRQVSDPRKPPADIATVWLLAKAFSGPCVACAAACQRVHARAFPGAPYEEAVWWHGEGGGGASHRNCFKEGRGHIVVAHQVVKFAKLVTPKGSVSDVRLGTHRLAGEQTVDMR